MRKVRYPRKRKKQMIKDHGREYYRLMLSLLIYAESSKALNDAFKRLKESLNFSESLRHFKCLIKV